MRRFDIAWRPSLFELAFGPRTFDCDVSALDVAGLLQTIAERGHMKCIAAGRRAVKEPDHWHRRLLRPRRQRPRRAAEKRYELAASYVGHGLLPGTRRVSLQQSQDAPEAPAGPWGRPARGR